MGTKAILNNLHDPKCSEFTVYAQKLRYECEKCMVFCEKCHSSLEGFAYNFAVLIYQILNTKSNHYLTNKILLK
jgi:hypothetical protein